MFSISKRMIAEPQFESDVFYVVILHLFISGYGGLVIEGNKLYWIFQEFLFMIAYLSGGEGAKRSEHMTMKSKE